MALISLASERRVRDRLVPELPVRATREEILRRARPGPWPRGSLRARSGDVVQVHTHVDGQSLLGQRSDAIRGPAILRRVYMADDQDVGAVSSPDNWRRVDFSETDVLQEFEFNGTFIPNGGGPDGVTLFPHVSFAQSLAAGLLRTGGWWLRAPSAADPEHILVWEPYLRIPYPIFFVKQYVQNDEAVTNRLMGMYFFEVQEGDWWDAREAGGADYIPVVGV